MRTDWQANAISTEEYYKESVKVARECADGKITSSKAEGHMVLKRRAIAKKMRDEYWLAERKRLAEIKKQRRFGS